ncbi:MAG TPA: hypothetical protein VMD28_09375 [Acidimicrobiales bacterium]|nr:hypothetical protein [Acidimicrobiales bacterium]
MAAVTMGAVSEWARRSSTVQWPQGKGPQGVVEEESVGAAV